MNKQTRIVFFVLIFLVAILAATTSFFFAKSRSVKNSSVAFSPQTNLSATSASAAPQPTSTSQVTKPASANEKPSKPADTYTVARGDTFFGIAQSQGTTVMALAEANAITDTDKIQANQILLIPKGNSINFLTDITRATELQKSADNGGLIFRLSPEETVHSDAPPVYGIKTTDMVTLKSKDENLGKAEVTASHEGKNYLVKLNQPVTKGAKGIWVIESIAPTS